MTKEAKCIDSDKGEVDKAHCDRVCLADDGMQLDSDCCDLLVQLVVHHTCISLHLAGRPDPSDDLQAALAVRYQLDTIDID